MILLSMKGLSLQDLQVTIGGNAITLTVWYCKYVSFLVHNHQIMDDKHLNSANNLMTNYPRIEVVAFFCEKLRQTKEGRQQF